MPLLQDNNKDLLLGKKCPEIGCAYNTGNSTKTARSKLTLNVKLMLIEYQES